MKNLVEKANKISAEFDELARANKDIIDDAMYHIFESYKSLSKEIGHYGDTVEVKFPFYRRDKKLNLVIRFAPWEDDDKLLTACWEDYYNEEYKVFYTLNPSFDSDKYLKEYKRYKGITTYVAKDIVRDFLIENKIDYEEKDLNEYADKFDKGDKNFYIQSLPFINVQFIKHENKIYELIKEQLRKDVKNDIEMDEELIDCINSLFNK